MTSATVCGTSQRRERRVESCLRFVSVDRCFTSCQTRDGEEPDEVGKRFGLLGAITRRKGRTTAEEDGSKIIYNGRNNKSWWP